MRELWVEVVEKGLEEVSHGALSEAEDADLTIAVFAANQRTGTRSRRDQRGGVEALNVVGEVRVVGSGWSERCGGIGIGRGAKK